MTEALYDLLYVMDSVITMTLKLAVIIVVFKLIRSRKNCLKELTRWFIK